MYHKNSVTYRIAIFGLILAIFGIAIRLYFGFFPNNESGNKITTIIENPEKKISDSVVEESVKNNQFLDYKTLPVKTMSGLKIPEPIDSYSVGEKHDEEQFSMENRLESKTVKTIVNNSIREKHYKEQAQIESISNNSKPVVLLVKKPTIMIVPSDVWCTKNGYVKVIDNQGVKTIMPDYRKAFKEDPNLLLVISSLNGLMADRGFPLKDLETVLKGLDISNKKNEAFVSRKTGASLNESPIDRIVKRAKADIVIQLTWMVNKMGPKTSIICNLQGLDSYTYKQIATATMAGAPSFTADLPALIKEAMLGSMESLTSTLQEHFNDMFRNGREVTLQILTWDDWHGDLEELSFEIEDWLNLNTVEGRFSTTDVTDTYGLFEQIRIPLFDTNGRSLDARIFFRGLSKKLSAPPYNESNKMHTEGLGKVTIILGNK
ncbi:DUF6175 family protein [Flavivirga aquimarina]|uniref:DUF6175 family protein n=1 Tax=Flavivirga aquimarina TaxID=2027862 RepID=A0ABT8WDC1_9FLAO|nr:DUF6175 family protein [Flavivirga aquimarina]MDO5971048.1 DUF6175 family protein [Flavivirga aquimarina]